jgi:hypothetical protein
MVIAILVSAVVAGRFISMTGSYTPIMIPAAILTVAGIAMMATFTQTTPERVWIPSLVLLGIGSGSGVATPFIAAQTVLDIKDISAGMALMTLSQDLGEAVFISVAQAIFLNRLASTLRTTVPALNPQDVLHLGATDLSGKVPSQDVEGVALAYNVGVRSTFYLAVALAATMVGAALPLQKSLMKEISAALKGAKGVLLRNV